MTWVHETTQKGELKKEPSILPAQLQHGESMSMVSGRDSNRGKWSFIWILRAIPAFGKMLEEVTSKRWLFSFLSTVLDSLCGTDCQQFEYLDKGEIMAFHQVILRTICKRPSISLSPKSDHQPQLLLGKMNFISLLSCLFVIQPCFRENLEWL